MSSANQVLPTPRVAYTYPRSPSQNQCENRHTRGWISQPREFVAAQHALGESLQPLGGGAGRWAVTPLPGQVRCLLEGAFIGLGRSGLLVHVFEQHGHQILPTLLIPQVGQIFGGPAAVEMGRSHLSSSLKSMFCRLATRGVSNRCNLSLPCRPGSSRSKQSRTFLPVS